MRFLNKIEPFEKNTSRYENWFEENKYAYESELLAIEKVLSKNKKTIEIGIGSGRFASPLGIKVGIDPSKKMLELAHKRGIDVVDAVAEYLPIREEAFRIAMMITTICFVNNIIAAFDEAFKILEANGSLVIGFVDKDSHIGKLYQKTKNRNVFYEKATFYSVKEVVKYLKKAGFSGFKYFQTIFHSLKDINGPEAIEEGYSKGSFVVIKASK
jgi:ubiquinone/menaquinone biosynthesis C-methylase UbiE